MVANADRAETIPFTPAPRARGQRERSGWGQSFCVIPKETIRFEHQSAPQQSRLGSCSRDPIGYQGSEWNLYEYVDSNALIFTDPSGEWVHIAGGCVVGGTVSGVVNWLTGGDAICGGVGGCVQGLAIAAFPGFAGGCIGGALAQLATMLCEAARGTRPPLNECDVLNTIFNIGAGCLGGGAAGQGGVVEIIAGLVGFNASLYSSFCKPPPCN